MEVVGYAVYRSREECELGERVATTGVGRTFRDELLPEGTFYYRVAELANTPREERVESLPSAVASVTVETGAPSFVRGDCDGDGELSGVTDAVALLEVLFLGRSRLLCLAACDADGDGVVKGEVTDAVFLLRHRFLGGPPPPAPFPTCGRGVSVRAAELGCDRPVRTCQ